MPCLVQVFMPPLTQCGQRYYHVFLLFVSMCVSLSVRLSQTLTRYLEKYCTSAHQTYSIGAFLDKYKCTEFWDQTVKVQGHGGVQHAGKCTIGLVNAISWKLLDWISNFQHWRILGQGAHQFLGSKWQRSKSHHDQGVSRQQSHTELDAVHWVLISTVWVKKIPPEIFWHFSQTVGIFLSKFYTPVICSYLR